MRVQAANTLRFAEALYTTHEQHRYSARRWRKAGSKVQVHHILSTHSKPGTIVSQIFQMYSHEHTTPYPGWISDFGLQYITKMSLSSCLSFSLEHTYTQLNFFFRKKDFSGKNSWWLSGIKHVEQSKPITTLPTTFFLFK